MEQKKQELFATLTNLLGDYQKTIADLKQQLTETKLDRDIYRERYKEETHQYTHAQNKTAFVAVHVLENKEGLESQKCIGVFSKKSLALEAIQNSISPEKPVHSFRVESFAVDHVLIPNEDVRVAQYDDTSTHEVATEIKGIFRASGTRPVELGCCYDDIYKVDVVYC